MGCRSRRDFAIEISYFSVVDRINITQ